MRSVSAKIMLWSVSALVLSLAVFIVVGQVVVGSTLMEGLSRFNDLHFQEARAAYESGGRAALSGYLDKLERSVGVRYHLIDASGKGVLTGQDQSARIRRGEPFRQDDQLGFEIGDVENLIRRVVQARRQDDEARLRELVFGQSAACFALALEFFGRCRASVRPDPRMTQADEQTRTGLAHRARPVWFPARMQTD